MATHVKFGEREAAFTGNFLLSRAGQKLTELNNTNLIKLYSDVAYNLVNGEYIQATSDKNFDDIDSMIVKYLKKSYFKTASLIGLNLKGISLIL